MQVFQPLQAQSEAESAAHDGVLQSTKGKKPQSLPIGSKIKYQKSLKHRASDPVVFGGIIDSSMVVGKDTMAISEIGYVQARNSRTIDNGKKVFFIGVGLLVLTFVFGLLGVAVALGSGFFLAIVLFALAYICSLAFLPMLIVGLVLWLSGKKWFDLRREWRLVDAGNASAKPQPKVKKL